MSLQQILGRFKQFVRSYEVGELFRVHDTIALRTAEALIAEAEERERREERETFRRVESARPRSDNSTSEKRAAYEEACRALGVSTAASIDTIASAYRAGISRHHPDRHGWKGVEEVREATRRTQELNKAFETIRRFRSAEQEV